MGPKTEEKYGATESRGGTKASKEKNESSTDPERPPGDPGVPLEQIDTVVDDDGADTRSIGHQRSIYTTKRLLIAFPALSVALFVSFLDQTSVSTAIPAISDDLDTGTATSWIGASFLIAATAFQLINGRLSDIFGRKNLLLVCLGLLAGGDLVCGFAKTKEQLFAFRAIAGIGGGGVNSVTLIIVSDITTLQNRGKFQGILGAILAIANGTGPFISGVIVQRATWRWVFWMIPIAAVPAGLFLFFFLPLKHDSGNYLRKVKMIDYGGIVLNLAGCLLILVAISGGGVTYPWNSAIVISLLTIGGLVWVAFTLYEWKLAKIPIMPLRLFTSPHCSYLYAQSFLGGTCFYGNFFYLPIYFQSALGYNALESGALILPVIVTTSISSVGSGQFMARVGRYMPLVLIGYVIWVLATGLRCMFSQTTGLGTIIGILIVEGVGIGMTLQTTLLGLLANSRDEDRAVLTGLRNFMRTIGGAFGLTISGAILSNTLSQKLSHLDFIDEEMIRSLSSSTHSIGKLGLTPAQQATVLDAYMLGLHYAFVYYATSAGLALLLTFGIGNTDLKSKSKKQDEEGNNDTEAHEEGGVLDDREDPAPATEMQRVDGTNEGQKTEKV